MDGKSQISIEKKKSNVSKKSLFNIVMLLFVVYHFLIR